MHQRKSDQSGFTLIELMVVIVILAALATAAVPSLMAGNAQSELRNTVRQIAQDLRRARYEAISSSEDRSLVFDFGAGSYTLQAVVPDQAIDTDTAAVLAVRTIPTDVELYATTNQAHLPGGSAPGSADSSPEEVRFTSTNNVQHGNVTAPPANASVTVYVKTKDGQHKSRIIVYRTTGYIKTYESWN